MLYLALCAACGLGARTPILVMPFQDEAERDRWASAHAAIGHPVLKVVDQYGSHGEAWVFADEVGP